VGLATSFYNDKDEGMADYLVKILLETGQPIPDFFAERVPEDKKVDFEDDSGAEDDDEGAQDDGGDSW
jgi:ATP-dependent RNA helicase DDX3X